jgi:ribonuclease HI
LNSTKTASITHEERRVVISAPYDASFVAAIKAELDSRRWDPKKKVWIVDIREGQKAAEITARFFSVTEKEKARPLPQELAAKPQTPDQSAIDPEWLNQGDFEIWVDGACLGNPGPGGYGILFQKGKKQKSRSGGFRLTTNNRMEILAAILALENIPERSRVTIHSDSKYVVDAMEKGWAKRWRSAGWMRNKQDKAINSDLWQRLLSLSEKRDVKFTWVRGHDANTENEWCDQLAQSAARSPDLPVDTGYQPTD